jgi:negative regulator of flagellin synthesis FlgM
MQIKNLIDGLGPYDKAKLEKAESDKAKARRGDKAAGKDAGDKVSLSPEAKLRTEAYKAAQDAPEVRHDKVAAIKAQIASGEYTVDSRKIAEKLVRDELDLGV